MTVWHAYAKINLSLEVTGRRSDHYHNVLTILQTVELHDTLTFAPAAELTLTCSIPSLANEDNLVLRAARLLQRATGRQDGAAIHLEKGIPVASGLGGGSSDAATALVALSQLWNLHMTAANLQNLAAVLGSDVPFFLVGGTALASDRGQLVEPLPALPQHWVVIVRPALDIPEKTQLMYAHITPREYTTGTVTRHIARLIRDKNCLEPGLIFNVFEWVAFQRFEKIDEVRQRVVDAGADHVRLCGAGPALYAIYREEGPASRLYEQLRGEGLESYLTHTVSLKPAPLEEQEPRASATEADGTAGGKKRRGRSPATAQGRRRPPADEH